MARSTALLRAFVLAPLLAACASPRPFPLAEATIGDMHAAMRAGSLNCRTVVQGYLDRIAAHDPALHAVIAVNPDALAEADALDRAGMRGPLHCVTVLVKDNIDVRGMPTTAGALAFAGNRPPEDAFLVARLRAAGAIVIGKANMDEFAFTYKGSSSIAGQALNAYDAGITPGGSSSGTGTGVAASLAMVGLGTDTGGSVRVPSAVQGLIGLRPSLRLLSQHGIVPLAPTEDTGGPMCRTVQDCALMMNALAGYDAAPGSGQGRAPGRASPQVASAGEYAALTHAPADYTAFLDAGGLRGARIGVLRQLFPAPDTPDKALFVATLDAALQRMRDAGAIVEDAVVPDLDTILSSFETVKPYEFRGGLESYLARWPSDTDHHLRSYRELVASAGFEPRNAGPIEEYERLGADPMQHPAYVRNISERFPFVRERLARAFDSKRFDVLVYPTRAGLNTTLDGKASNNPRTSRLSSFSGYPALSMPVAMVVPPGRTAAQPVGIELLAREFDEATLIRIAYAWQQTAQARRAP
jgi:amidase